VKDTLIGYIFAVFTVMMWSMNIIYSKYLAGLLTPSEISFLRWFIALFLMIPITLPSLKRDFRKLFRLWKIVLLMALSGLGVQNWLIYCAGYTASATNMSLISILGPVFLIMLSGQKISFLQTVGVVASIGGVMMIILRGHFSNLEDFRFVSGDFYMLGSAFLFAVYALVQHRLPEDVDQKSLLTAAIVVSALMFFFPAYDEFAKTSWLSMPLLVWGILLILGVINSALAYLSWDLTIRKLGTIRAGTMYYTLPIFSITAAYYLLGERIYAAQIWGALMIVFGIFCVIFGTPKESGR
jgi:drug/metabolite transporter (DMT)-like permease